VRGNGLTTKQLIDAALRAQSAYSWSVIVLGRVAQAVRAAFVTVQATSKAVHDDLEENGPCCVVDNSTNPPTVTAYIPADPDSFMATQIRVA
jgi:hypothetical protein